MKLFEEITLEYSNYLEDKDRTHIKSIFKAPNREITFECVTDGRLSSLDVIKKLNTEYKKWLEPFRYS